MMRCSLFFVDLPKDGGLVLNDFIAPPQETSWQTCNFPGKGQFCPWENADRYACIFRRRKATRARAEVTRGELVANLGWPRFDREKAIITHLGPPHFGKPLT